MWDRSRRTVAAAVAAAAMAISAGHGIAQDLTVPFAIDATRSDPARPSRPLGKTYRGPLFDTHTHLAPLGGRPTDANAVVVAMREADVARVVLLPPPNAAKMAGIQSSLAQMQALRQSSAGAVLAMCGSDYLTDWMNAAAQRHRLPDGIDSQMGRLERDLKSGACAGVGEIGVRHYAKAAGEQVIDLPAGYPPLLTLAETVARANALLDIHAEPVEPKGTRHDAEAFGTVAAMFARAPNLRLIYSHTAMTNPHNARALLQAFPTLMMNVNFGKHTSGVVDWENLEGVTNEGGELYADWAALFEDMPDRFMVGTDTFFSRANAAKHYAHKIKQVRRALGSLSGNAAKRIAYDNAERVFGPARRQ